MFWLFVSHSFWRGKQAQQVGATEQVPLLEVSGVPLNKGFGRASVVGVKPSDALLWCMLPPCRSKGEDGFEWRVAWKQFSKYNHLIFFFK